MRLASLTVRTVIQTPPNATSVIRAFPIYLLFSRPAVSAAPCQTASSVETAAPRPAIFATTATGSTNLAYVSSAPFQTALNAPPASANATILARRSTTAKTASTTSTTPAKPAAMDAGYVTTTASAKDVTPLQVSICGQICSALEVAYLVRVSGLSPWFTLPCYKSQKLETRAGFYGLGIIN